jgi:hypothetical protein
MRKSIYPGLLTLLIAMLFGCAGMPDSSSESSTSDSYIFGNNFQSVVYESIGNQNLGLIGGWIAEDNGRNSYSVIEFDQNNNFVEKVRSQLTHEIIASYDGKYNVNIDVLEIVANDGDIFEFAFSINANRLQLSAK